MKAVKNEFPNPVLATGRDDYIEKCRFQTNFEEDKIIVDNENIVIPIKYTLICDGLQRLINTNEAVVVVKVKSSAASYSRLSMFPIGENEMIVKIPKYSVVTKIDLEGAIIAAKNIDQFRCEGEFNDLYFGTTTFEIRKGDILASENSRSIYIDDTELEKPISSIFDISRNNEQDEDVIPNFEDQKITIYLKSDLYKLYYYFKDFNNGRLRRYATSVIVYPVLVEAICLIQKNDDNDSFDYSEKRWFRAIEHKAESKGIDLKSEPATTLADKMLGDIAFDALKNFKDTLDSEINSGETQMIGGVD